MTFEISNAMSTLPENGSVFQDVPAADNYVDDDMELFNLSMLSDNDLLPEELPYQVRSSYSLNKDVACGHCIKV